MNKTNKLNVVFGLDKKSKMSLSYCIAGFYTDQNIIGSKNWHSLMWKIFGHIGKTYSNDPSDQRPTFTSIDNDKIRNIKDISEFEEAYPEIAKIAKSQADLFNSSSSPEPVQPKADDNDPLEQRMSQIEQTLALIASKLK